MATHIKVVKTKNKNSNDGSISSLYYTYLVQFKTLLKQTRESFSLKLSLENYCSSRLLNSYNSLYTWLPASYLKSSKLKVNWSSPWSWTEARWHFLLSPSHCIFLPDQLTKLNEPDLLPISGLVTMEVSSWSAAKIKFNCPLNFFELNNK